MEKKKRILLLCIIISVVCITALSVFLYTRLSPKTVQYGFARTVPEAEAALRTEVIVAAEAWLDSNEADGSHQQIIDLYNAHTPLAQGYAVQYDDDWCATFVSTVSIQLELTDLIPTECGCQRQIALFRDMGRWIEEDDYVPLPGDIIYYCMDNKDRSGDCTDWSDHVGIVVGTAGDKLKVIEGNWANKVTYRYLTVDHHTIRGYGIPDYASIS